MTRFRHFEERSEREITYIDEISFLRQAQDRDDNAERVFEADGIKTSPRLLSSPLLRGEDDKEALLYRRDIV